MKRVFTVLAIIVFNLNGFLMPQAGAQSPQKMSYQAVIRNSSNQLITNQTVGLQVQILQGSTNGIVVYSEIQTPGTNANGLISIEIGGGNGFDAIDWSNGPYFIKVETDPNGGTNYTISGTSQLLSVPFALYANTAENLTGTLNETDPVFAASAANGITSFDLTDWTAAYSWGNHANAGYLTSFTETDPIFTASASSTITNANITNWNSAFDWGNHALAGYLIAEVDGSITNELQSISISNDSIFLSDGGKVRLPDKVEGVNILNDSLFITYSYGQVVNAGYVGSGSPGTSLSSVVTIDVTDINYTNAYVNAEITSSGNEFILNKGVCLSKNANPSLNDTVYTAGTGTGSFTINCNLLLPNTFYYVRAFATNTLGTTYGNELSFLTKALTVPDITTVAISNITNTTAFSGGNITDDGGTPILDRGICWSLNPYPTTSDLFVSEGVGTESYIALMSGLTSNTTYYVRAYATNAQGTSYGDELSFTTIVYQLATLSTTAASSISYTTAIAGGNVSNDNGSPVTSRGICWATTTLPTTANSNYTEAGGLGSFTANMSGLSTNTTYYVRAFAVNGGGTSYGNEVSFTTLTPSVAALTTKSISGISSNIAGSGGVITTDGGSAITAKGVCWSLNPSPTLTNSFTNDGTGTASYNSTMNGLNPLTTYYVRAYATNSLGTSYGNEISFTTTDLVNPGPTVPVIGTSTSAITGSSTASSGGYVSSDGGSSVTMRGVCWSTNINPTLADNFSTDGGTGIGFFSSTLTGLIGCGTIYYIRAYATNSTGTGYGNQNTVSTGLLPTVTTDDISSIDYYTAISGGSITDDGGCPITQKGVCWNYLPNPTIGNPHTSEGAGSDAFVSNITGLYANRTYYVRAYATNNVGTVYGPEKVFTTTTPSTPYIGQNYAGGIIFYLDGSGEHGLVCASTDQGGAAWGCEGSSIPTSTAFGTGATNTAAIVASCGEANIAAKICDNLELNGYSDWFLPATDELYFMYINLHAKGLGSFSNNWYWSSSESNASQGYVRDFSYNGNQYTDNKSRSWESIRAVRAF